MSPKMEGIENIEEVETNIPNSSSRRRNIKTTVKSILFVICLIGFGYQVLEFCSYFLTFPTVISVDVQVIESFVLPALTFCNVNPVQRTKYCEKYPTRCGTPKDKTKFCGDFSHYCKRNSSNLKIPKQKYRTDSPKPENRLTEDDIIELGQNPNDFDVTSNDAEEDTINAGNLTRVYFTNANKDFFLCYTTNARYTYTPDLPPKKFESSDEGVPTNFALYLFNVQPEESFRYNTKHGLRFMIHSPYLAINPYTKGMTMIPGYEYKVHVKKEEDNLLPYPYKTDCVNYDDVWNRTGHFAPRSQQMCKNNCHRDFNLECYGCEKNLTFYLANDKVCKLRDDINCSSTKPEDELRRNLNSCLGLCKKDCQKWRFPFTVEVIPEESLKEKNLILVSVTMYEQDMVVLTHKPQYEKIELFSYIGGFMGCWMGLSIWAFTTCIGSTIPPAKAGFVTLRRRISGRLEGSTLL